MGGVSVFVGLLILFMWLGPVWRRRIVGLGAFTDIGVHFILQVLLGGASEGRMAMLFGGVMFNIALMVYRKLRGSSTVVNGVWVTHSGWFYRAKQRPTGSSASAS
jgi:hypothetical protein